jgi:hypothetical protein
LWWKNIISLEKAVPGKNWLVDAVVRKVGNGRDTFSWSSKWIGVAPLAVAFPRLLSLSNCKDSVVADLLQFQGERRYWRLSWRRNHFQ